MLSPERSDAICGLRDAGKALLEAAVLMQRARGLIRGAIRKADEADIERPDQLALLGVSDNPEAARIARAILRQTTIRPKNKRPG